MSWARACQRALQKHKRGLVSVFRCSMRTCNGKFPPLPLPSLWPLSSSLHVPWSKLSLREAWILKWNNSSAGPIINNASSILHHSLANGIYFHKWSMVHPHIDNWHIDPPLSQCCGLGGGGSISNQDNPLCWWPQIHCWMHAAWVRNLVRAIRELMVVMEGVEKGLKVAEWRRANEEVKVSMGIGRTMMSAGVVWNAN